MEVRRSRPGLRCFSQMREMYSSVKYFDNDCLHCPSNEFEHITVGIQDPSREILKLQVRSWRVSS